MIRWLHLTDLHVGRASNTHEENALKLLIDDLRDHWPFEQCDAILLTGDLAWSGTTPEYDRLWANLLAPILEIPAFSNASLLVVPGNHDVDCDASSPMSWDRIGESRRDTFYQENAQGVKVRQPRAAAFCSFEAFLDGHNCVGPRPSRVVTTSFEFEVGDSKVRFLLTNTAFFCDKAPDLREQGQLPAPTPSLRSLAEEEVVQTFVLGHHPVNWLIFRDQEPFKRLLRDKNATYLHGHTHEIEATLGTHGLASLGLGAAYQNSPDAPADPYYRNSYAFCCFNEDRELHVGIRSWRATVGGWIREQELPAEFDEQSQLIDGHVFRYRKSAAHSPQTGGTFRPKPPRPDKVWPLITPTEAHARAFLNAWLPRRGFPDPANKLRSDSESPGRYSYLYVDGDTHRFLVIAQPGYVMARSFVEEMNNEIDYESFRSSTTISFGALASDAKTAYIRLKATKPLAIIAEQELVEVALSLMTSASRAVLKAMDSTVESVEIIWAEVRLELLVTDRLAGRFFYVVDERGQVLPEAADTVVQLRKARPSFVDLAYRTAREDSAPSGDASAFDRGAYLEQCEKEYNAVKYAALAHTGLRLSSLSLAELYVAASGDVAEGADTVLHGALEDLIDGYGLDPEISRQLHAHARRIMSVGPSAETGLARRLYQRHANVLVLGDPGSGKSCFAKYEVLAYCKPPRDTDWYNQHTPIYVPLIDAARYLPDLPDASLDILDICSKALSRQGLLVSVDQLSELVSDGKAAFFFDGVDEVASVSERSRLLRAIGDLMDQAAARGCRFVLGSRPAAVRVVEVPKGLKPLHLKGLTTNEMRDLAERIVAAQGVGIEALAASPKGLREEDSALIDKLMLDCETVPGIAKLARNPLLLTLLVLIYWNSGPPAARRHRIYQQAVQSLVSVRSRQAGQRLLSEADLRTRLGALALFVFEKKDGLLPTFSEALDVIQSVIQRQRGRTVDLDEVTSFIQDVAEATGLLVLHEPHDADQEGVVSFMHHSFMEYYAAVGLLERDDWLVEASRLAKTPRWREVISLLAGIHGDQSDITGFITRILEDASASERFTHRALEFAFDCALESEVPPESTIDLLVRQCIEEYPDALVQDLPMLRRLGQRLASLYARTASPIVDEALIRALGTEPRRQVALEMLGYVARDSDLTPDCLATFVEVCGGHQPNDIEAICRAVGRAPKLRVPAATAVVHAAFDGNQKHRAAAVRAVESAPSLVKESWNKVVECAQSDDGQLAMTAANAMMSAGFAFDPTEASSRSRILPALKAIHRHGDPRTVTQYGINVNRDQVAVLLSDVDEDTREVGLLLLPWVHDSEFVYEHCMGFAANGAREHDVEAALSALRLAEEAQDLVRVRDEGTLLGLLGGKSKTVRMAVLRLLQDLGYQSCLDAVMDRAQQAGSGPEYRAAVEALATYGLDPSVHVYLTGRLDGLLKGKKWKSELRSDFQSVCIAITRLEDMDNQQYSGVEGRLRQAIRDYKNPADVRAASLHCLAALARPTLASMRTWLDLLKSPPVVAGVPKSPTRRGPKGPPVSPSKRVPTMEVDVGRAIAAFFGRIRGDIDAIRGIHPLLGEVEAAVVASIRDGGVARNLGPVLRDVLDELNAIKSSYDEFSPRMSPT